ncbi:MAG: DUF1538 domain-containing protein [Oscillospiraceae bacterium]|nr:DUF1538 domain-containing protein [Oscillospiraceae bacterium]
MREKLIETTKGALVSVLPISAVVYILSVTIVPIPIGTLALFIFGAILLIVGMGLFILGVDMFLVTLGEDFGATMTKSKKAILVVIVSLIMGFIITVAEPALQVQAKLVPGIPDMTLIFTVSAGVGIFLLIGVFRILLRIPLSILLAVMYIGVMILSIFVPDNFAAVAFDSGGVTTGPVTVPFIMAMGLGLASVRGDKEAREDSFGLVALGSIGPIISVMILGLFYKPDSVNPELAVIPEVQMSQDVLIKFAAEIPSSFYNVAMAMWPILAALIVFQGFTKRYHKRDLVRIFIGFIYTFVGLALFFAGVDVGFIPIGQFVGKYLAESSMKWLLIPLGAVIGYFIVAAEPAVHVLKKQIEEVSGGGIPGKAVLRYLSIGTAGALAISMLRALTGISLYWFLIPGYAAAIIMTFHTPKIFTGIAFDSGGVITGPMISTFLLPFSMGVCLDPSKIMTDAFGLVAMIALTPLITLQLMGMVYKKRIQEAKNIDLPQEEFVEFEEFDFDYDIKDDPRR